MLRWNVIDNGEMAGKIAMGRLKASVLCGSDVYQSARDGSHALLRTGRKLWESFSRRN